MLFSKSELLVCTVKTANNYLKSYMRDFNEFDKHIFDSLMSAI